MATVGEVVARMRAALAVTEPELDTSIGTPVRKILDAVAEQIAAVTIDQHMLQYQFDIDAKRGADLDDFVMMFGFSRFQPRRASGVVVFSRPQAADQDYVIPAGTQITTGTGSSVVFSTFVAAYLLKGNRSVEVPVEAVVGGSSGNLPAGSLTRLATPVNGVSAATNNPEPTSGGTDAESDEALIARFKRTVFRSLAGTEDMFLGVALEDTSTDDPSDRAASQAVVMGASRRWREQVQIGSDGTAKSTIVAANVKYIYPNSSVFGADIDSGSILTPGVHYTFDSSVTPPVIRSLSGALTVGEIYDLDFEYSPRSSRNDPANGITNRVDIWVNGERATSASETVYFRRSRVFTAATGFELSTDRFVRRNTVGTRPAANNVFVQLAYGPVLAFPNQLMVNGTAYLEGKDYWIVHDDTAFGYGPTSLFGLEWAAGDTHTPQPPTDGRAISLSGGNSYVYNRLPRDVEDRARRWRLVTTDVRAHAARRIYLRLNFAVMYDQAYDRGQVSADLSQRMAAYLDGRGFEPVVQISDLLQVAASVQGVDNIRFLTSAESASAYAVQQVSSDGAVIRTFSTGTPGRATDIFLADNEIPVLHSINVALKAQNSFGSM